MIWRLQHLRTASRERTDGRTGQAAKYAAQDGKQWIGLPGKPYTKPGEGEQSWTNIVDFADNKSHYLFQDEALPLVLAAFAEVSE